MTRSAFVVKETCEWSDALTVMKAAAGHGLALVRLRMSVHRRVEVPLWRCFPPRVVSNCVLARQMVQLDRDGSGR